MVKNTATASAQDRQDAINSLLRERLAPYGFDHATAVIGEDHDGDDVLFVDLYYNLTEQALDPKAVYGLTDVIRTRLTDLGEDHPPVVRHHFHEDQKVA